jgi:hypothetical protein
MQQLIVCLALLGLLAGCATTSTPYEPPVRNRDIVYVQVAFDDLPNGTRIDFQHGQRVPDGDLDWWTTYCRLYVYNRHHDADYLTSVQPGQFEIVGVQVRYDSVDSLFRPWGFSGPYWYDHMHPAYYVYMIGMRLASTDQPEVQSLDCYRKWGTRGPYYPTLDEIREALGDLIEIRPQNY